MMAKHHIVMMVTMVVMVVGWVRCVEESIIVTAIVWKVSGTIRSRIKKYGKSRKSVRTGGGLEQLT